MTSTNKVFSSDWKSAHIWSSRERLEITVGNKDPKNSQADWVYLEVVTQNLAGRILAFLGSLFGKKTSFGCRVKTMQTIQVALSGEQTALISNSLNDKAKAALSIDQLERELERQIHAFALSVIAPKAASGSDEPSLSPPATPAATSEPTDQPHTISAQTSDGDAISTTSSSEEDSFSDDISTIDPTTPAPLTEQAALERLHTAKEAFDRLLAAEHQAGPGQYETTWLGKWLDGDHPWLAKARYAIGSVFTAATDWIPGRDFLAEIGGAAIHKTATASAKALDDAADVIQGLAIDDDQRELAMLERLDTPTAQLAQELTLLAAAFAEGTAGYQEHAELQRQVAATRRVMDTWRAYFAMSDKLDAAMGRCAEQRETLFQGKLDLSTENYLAMARQAEEFAAFIPASTAALAPYWQRKIEKQCHQQIDQALGYLHDFAADLNEEMAAELAEATAQFRDLQATVASGTRQQEPFHIEELQSLHAAYNRYKTIHRSSAQLVKDLNRHRKELQTHPHIGSAVNEDYSLFATALQGAEKAFSKPKATFHATLSVLLQRLELFAPPQEALMRRLDAYEAKLAKHIEASHHGDYIAQITPTFAHTAHLAQLTAPLVAAHAEYTAKEKQEAIKQAIQAAGAEAARRMQEKGLEHTIDEGSKELMKKPAGLLLKIYRKEENPAQTLLDKLNQQEANCTSSDQFATFYGEKIALAQAVSEMAPVDLEAEKSKLVPLELIETIQAVAQQAQARLQAEGINYVLSEDERKHILENLPELLQTLRTQDDPKEYLLARLATAESQAVALIAPLIKEELDKQLARSYNALAYLGRLATRLALPDFEGVAPEKNAAIKANLAAALRAIGQTAAERKEQQGLAYTYDELYADIFRDTLPLTSQKKRVLETHRYCLDATPSGSIKWNIFFGWLQLWETVSPLAGLAGEAVFGIKVQPVGERDYNFHMAMMRKTAKTDPEQYAYHLKMLRGVFGMHPEYEDFLTQYDLYLRGDVSFSMEPIAAPAKLASPAGGTAQAFGAISTEDAAAAHPESFDKVPASWWQTFFGTAPDQAAWKDKSDWEKYCHYTIYPQVRDSHFDAMLNIFDAREFSSPPLSGTPEERMTYHLYKMYHSVKTPGGEGDYAWHLAQARQIRHYTPFLKEFHQYLQARSAAFSLPLREVPTSSWQMGKAVLHRLEQDADALAAYVARVEEQVGGNDVMRQQQRLVEQRQQQLDDLAKNTPPEYSTDVDRWLKMVNRLRHDYLDGEMAIRSATAFQEWGPLITTEKLKALVRAPAVPITAEMLGSVFDAPRTGIDLLKVLAYDLDIVKTQIGAAHDGAICGQETVPEFCAEAEDNPVFKAVVTDASHLDQLYAKVEQALSLSHAFVSAPDKFGQQLGAALAALSAGGSLFFLGQDAGIAHEITKQHNGRFTLGTVHTDPEAQRTHAQLFAGAAHRSSIYLETPDVPLAMLLSDELHTVLKGSEVMPTAGRFEQLSSALNGLFSSKHLATPRDRYVDKLPSTPYQMLAAMFQRALDTPASQRLAFEWQLKALADFQHLNSHLYSEPATHQLVERASTDFLAQLTKWHEQQVVNGGDLSYALEIVQDIKASLSAAAAKHAEALQQASALPSLAHMVGQPMTIDNAALEASYLRVDDRPLHAHAADTPYHPPLVFAHLSAEAFPQHLESLVEYSKSANAHGLHENNIIAVHRFVQQLSSLDKGFWQTVIDATQDPHQLINSFAELSKEFQWSLLQRASDVYHPLNSKLTVEDYFTQIGLHKRIADIYNLLPADANLPPHLHIPLYLPAFTAIFEGKHPYMEAPTPEWAERLKAFKKEWFESEPEKLAWDSGRPLSWPAPEQLKVWKEAFPDFDEQQPRASIFTPNNPDTTPYPRTEEEWAAVHQQAMRRHFEETKEICLPSLKAFVDEWRDFLEPVDQPVEEWIESHWEQLQPLYQQFLLTDGTFTLRKYSGSADAPDAPFTEKTISVKDSNIPKPLPASFMALRQLAISTDLTLRRVMPEDMSRELFDQGITRHTALAIDANGALSEIPGRHGLHVFGAKWEWPVKDPITGQGIADIDSRHILRQETPFDRYFHGVEQTLTLGLIDTDAPVNKRFAAREILAEVVKRIERGDKTPIKLMRQLLALRSIKEIQASEVLNFYTTHMELLNDPDHQQLLKRLLLEPGVLAAEFDKHPRDNLLFAEKLAAFFRKGIDFYKRIKDKHAASFLASLNQQVATATAAHRDNYRIACQLKRQDLPRPDFFTRYPDERQNLVRWLESEGYDAATAAEIMDQREAWVGQCEELVAHYQKQVKNYEELVAAHEAPGHKRQRNLETLTALKADLQTAEARLARTKDTLLENESALKTLLEKNGYFFFRTSEDYSTLAAGATAQIPRMLQERLPAFLVGSESQKISPEALVNFVMGLTSFEKLNETFAAYKNFVQSRDDMFPTNYASPFIDSREELAVLVGKGALKSKTTRLLDEFLENASHQIYLENSLSKLKSAKSAEPAEPPAQSEHKTEITSSFLGMPITWKTETVETDDRWTTKTTEHYFLGVRGGSSLFRTQHPFSRPNKEQLELQNKWRAELEESSLKLDDSWNKLKEQIIQHESLLPEGRLRSLLTGASPVRHDVSQLRQFQNDIRSELERYWPTSHKAETATLLYSRLALSYASQSDLSLKEAQELLHAVISSHFHDLPHKLFTTSEKAALNELLRDKQQVLADLLAKHPQELLNGVYKLFRHHAAPLEWSGTFPVFTSANGRVEIDVLAGRLYVDAAETGHLAETLKTHPLYTGLFGEAALELVKQRNNGGAEGREVYLTTDRSGYTYRLIAESDALAIQRQYNGNWYQLVHEEEEVAAVQAKLPPPLAEGFRYWHYKDEIVLTDRTTGQPRYLVSHRSPGNTSGKKIWVIDAEGTSHKVLTEPASCPLAAGLARIEDPQFMLIMQEAKSGLVTHATLPRLGLSFAIEEQDGRWRAISQEFDGFELSAQQHVPALGSRTNYLLLEKKTSAGDDKKIVLLPFDLQPDGEKAPTGYLAYDLVRTDDQLKLGKLHPQTDAAAFFFARNCLQERDYVQAFKWIKHYEHWNRALDPDSVRILHAFADLDHDDHPRALAVKLKAMALLIRQKFDFKNPDVRLDGDELLETFAAYLETQRPNDIVSLSRNDERLILEQSEQMLDPSALLRQRIVLLRKRALDRPLTIEQQLELGSATTMEGKAPGKPVGFSSINARKYFPLLTDEVVELYAALRNKDAHVSTYALSQAAKPFIGSQGLNLFTTETILEALNQHFLKHLSADDEEKALESLLLKAVMDHSEAFPDSLEPLEALKTDDSKKKWIRDNLTHPLLEVAISDEALKQHVFGVPVHSYLANPTTPPAPTPPVFQLTLPLELPAPFHDLPVVTLADLSLRKVMPDAEAIAKNKKYKSELDAFCAQKLRNNIAAQELAAVQAEIDAYYGSGAPLQPTYEISDRQKFAEAQSRLEARSRTIEGTLLAMKDSIEALANKLPEDAAQRALRQAQLLSGEFAPLSIKECLLHLLYPTAEQTHDRNPALTIEEIKQLRRDALEFLMLATEKHHLDNLLGLAKNEASLQKLGMEVEHLRAYNSEEDPALALLDFASRFWLRSDQLDAIKKVVEKGDIDQLEELIMAFGKTSTIIPALSFLNADGKKLSITVLPQELIESMQDDYQNKLETAFNQMVQALGLDRNMPANKEFLAHLLENFVTAIRDKHAVLMSKESWAALYLKFFETLHLYHNAHATDPTAPMPTEVWSCFQQIFTITRENGYVIFDEIHKALASGTSTHYTMGTKRKLIEINEVMGQTVIDFYRFLQENPSILTVDTDSHTEQAFFAESYHKVAKPRLIQAVLDGKIAAKSVDFKHFLSRLSPVDRTHVENFLYGKMDEATLAFTNTISDPKAKDALALNYYLINSLYPETASKNRGEHYGFEVLDEKGTRGVLAVPYDNGKAPIPGTQFGDPLTTIAYAWLNHETTVSMVRNEIQQLKADAMQELKAGTGATSFKKTKAGQTWKELVGDATDYQIFALHDEDYEAITALINQKPSNAYYFFEKYTLPAIEVYETQLDADSQVFGMLFAKTLGLTGTAANAQSLPPMEVTYSSTRAKTLDLLFKNTPDQVTLVHSPSSASPEDIKASLLELVGDSPETLSLIDVGGVFNNLPGEEVAKQLYLIGKEKGWDCEVIGFYGADGKIMGVTLDDQGRWVVDELEKLGIPVDQRGFAWLQAYYTGSDIKLNPTMKAVATLNRHTQLNNKMQGAWRMRGLDQLQIVRFAVLHKDERIIRLTLEKMLGISLEGKPIGRNEVILYTLIMQAYQQGEDNYRSFNQKLHALLREKAFMALLKVAPEEMPGIYAASRGLFESTRTISPYEMYARPLVSQPKEEVIERDINAFLDGSIVKDFLDHPVLRALVYQETNKETDRDISEKSDEDIKKGAYEGIKKAAEQLKEREFAHLPDEIMSANDYGKTRTVQTQKQQATQTQKQQQVATRTQKTAKTNIQLAEAEAIAQALAANPPPPTEPWPKHGLFGKSYFNDVNAPGIAHALAGAHPDPEGIFSLSAVAFSDRHLCSHNVCHADDSSRMNYVRKIDSKLRWEDLPAAVFHAPFTTRQMGCNQVLLIRDKDTGKIKLLIISPEEEIQFRQMFIDASHHPADIDAKTDLALYDLQTGYYASNALDKFPSADYYLGDHTYDLLQLIVQAKFLKGEVNYSSREKLHLEHWFKKLSKLKLSRLQRLFETSILPWSVTSYEEYSKSTLAQLWKKLRAADIDAVEDKPGLLLRVIKFAIDYPFITGIIISAISRIRFKIERK